jgi:hypothetical protein
VGKGCSWQNTTWFLFELFVDAIALLELGSKPCRNRLAKSKTRGYVIASPTLTADR